MGNLLDKINTCRRQLKNLDNPFGDRDPRVLMVGLDGAGKTSVLYKAKLDDAIFANPPPRGINIEMMTPRRGCRLQVYDMPGHKMTRHLWHNWFMGTEAIVYVVDSVDKVRIDEAKFELHDLLKSRYLRRVPLIVLANKQDTNEAMNADMVSTELDLSLINDRDWSIHGTNVTKGMGIMPAFQDVVDKVKAYRHYKSGLVTKEELIRQSDIQKDIEEKPEETESTDKNDNTNIPSLFATINKETEIESAGDEAITKECSESNERSGSGSSGIESNPAEYDRPANLVEVNVDVSSNDDGSEKAISEISSNIGFEKEISDEKALADEVTFNKRNCSEDFASVGVATSDKVSDDESLGSNSVTEHVIVHSAQNSDTNTNNDDDSEILNNDDDNGEEEHVEFRRQGEKVTDLDAYSNDSELDFTNEEIDSLNQTYEFEPNAPVAVV